MYLKKILLLDNGKEWGGGTNSMLELLKRINKDKFNITCCFYYNYKGNNHKNIKTTLQNMNIKIIFIKQMKEYKFIKILKEILRFFLFFNKRTKKKLLI